MDDSSFSQYLQKIRWRDEGGGDTRARLNRF